MENKLYQEMFNLEKNHWWFVGRRRILFDVIRRTIAGKAGKILDVGCGTGLNALFLRNVGNEVYGLEMSDDAIRFARERAPQLKIIKGEFPYAEIQERFGLITLFDVLEHCEDDAAALKKIAELLNPGGWVALSVPAFSFLWSEHDELAHHMRRYTAPQLRQKLENAGFRVARLRYFNTFLFGPTVLFRVLRNFLGLRRGSSDFFMLPGPMNTLLAALFGAERFLLRFFNFPFGVSLIIVAEKKQT